MVAYLLLFQPIRAKLDALTVTLSEISIALLFTVNICFFFDISPNQSSKIELIATLSLFTGVFIPSIAGFLSLFLQFREVVKRYRRMKYAVQVCYHESGRGVAPIANGNDRQAAPLAY